MQKSFGHSNGKRWQVGLATSPTTSSDWGREGGREGVGGAGGGHPQVHHPLGISDSVVDDKLPISYLYNYFIPFPYPPTWI